MDFERAVEHALNGEAILFAGAGFSVGALNQKNESLKTGGQLAKLLSSEIGISDGILPLDDAAEEYQEEFGEDKFIDLLKREFTVGKTTDSQRIITQVPWRRIYTTNYDNVIEMACGGQKDRTVSSVSLLDKIQDLPKDSICVHLNGCITRLNRATLRDEIKLTDTSYLTSNVADSDWAKLFRQDLNIARSVFFVGYSLADLDIRRILFDQELLQPKSFFIIGRTPDTRTIRRVSKFGNVCKMDTNAFAQAVTKILGVYTPPKETELAWYCFEVTKDVGNSTRDFSDRDFLNLLAYGHFTGDLIVKSMYQGISYYCKRSKIEQVLDLLENNIRYAVVHSELGNGKTLFLEGLKFRAIERGYLIFSLIKRSQNIYKEVDQIGKQTSKALVIIENYYDWFDVIDYIGMNNFPNLKIVFSARTPIHDLTVDALIDGLETNDISDISIDYLDEFEINWIINIFDEYGLWGKQAAWSHERKKRHITRECQSQFHAALLSVIEAPQILDRLTIIIEKLQQKSQYFEVIVSILVLSILGRTIRLSILYELWGHRIHDGAFRRDPFLREIIDFGSDSVQMRSSITAKYILNPSCYPLVVMSFRGAERRGISRLSAKIGQQTGDSSLVPRSE